jgi:hypothetical protein
MRGRLAAEEEKIEKESFPSMATEIFAESVYS